MVEVARLEIDAAGLNDAEVEKVVSLLGELGQDARRRREQTLTEGEGWALFLWALDDLSEPAAVGIAEAVADWARSRSWGLRRRPPRTTRLYGPTEEILAEVPADDEDGALAEVPADDEDGAQ